MALVDVSIHARLDRAGRRSARVRINNAAEFQSTPDSIEPGDDADADLMDANRVFQSTPDSIEPGDLRNPLPLLQFYLFQSTPDSIEPGDVRAPRRSSVDTGFNPRPTR